ncbi:MAG: DUF805 domain-containing protein [Pseudomonadota bacterium]
MMTPPEAVAGCFSKYLSFSGRARRPEFWWFLLFVLLGNVAFGAIDTMLGFGAVAQLPEAMQAQDGVEPLFEYEAPSPLAFFFGLATMLPLLAVAARRLHDRSMSGWWLLALLLPVMGQILILIFLALPGKEEENEWGPVIAAD